MTYSIIPPLLLVLSLIGILLFLLKKAPQVASLDQSDPEKDISSGSSQGILGYISRKVQREGRENFKQSFLVVLEKITRRFKVMFLKLENMFTSWNEVIRSKRRERLVSKEEASKREDIIEKKINLEAVEKEGLQEEKRRFNRSSLEQLKRGNLGREIRQRVTRAMLSEKVVMPKSKVELKGRLEKILIDRIASNPKDIEAYERLGEYYLEIENFEYAKECFKQVIKLDPTNFSAKSKMRRLERLLGS